MFDELLFAKTVDGTSNTLESALANAVAVSFGRV